MSKLSKILSKTLLPITISCAVMSTDLNAQKQNYFNSGFSPGFTYEFMPIKIHHVPESIRDVPLHYEDSLVNPSNWDLIDDCSLNLNHSFYLGEFKFNFGRDFSKNFRIDAGIGFDLGIRKKAMKSRNYTTNPGSSDRGRGAALTYYEISPRFFHKRNNAVRPMPFVEAQFNLSDKFGIQGGFSFFNEKIVAVNGWDRYDHLQRASREILSDGWYGRFKFSLKFIEDDMFENSLDFGVMSLLKGKNSTLGNEAGLNFPNTAFFIGFRANISYRNYF